MDLTKVARSWTEADGEIPAEWAQRTFYGKPVVADRIEELVGRISLFTTESAKVLKLWDPEREALNVRDVLAGLQLRSETYDVALSPESRTPIESGYLECMRLVPAHDGVAADALISAFARLQQDRYPDMEHHLVDCYGTLTPERKADQRFRSIDYSAFDLGPVKLGLGLFAEHTPHHLTSIWCWSRVVNWHK